YRWFLGYTLQEETPHFSTVSYNFRHRFTEETVDQVLTYRTTNRDGYREYRSDPRICVNCPTRHLCTRSKDCVKTVQR
ncbi:transposase, partial [Pseudoflavonifractor phocaeensis]|uniref:transposase n=1 Tax=Pseudoflavonifractor phocaeensis TaxID=1870988 RepID=UPI00195C66D8